MQAGTPADATSGSAANLVVTDPDGHRTRVAVQPFPFEIGRAQGNALVLRDGRVSRTHARITSENGNCVLEDAGSRHGVWVNGARINGKYALEGGERIEFGVPEGYLLQFTRTAEDLERFLTRAAAQESRPGGGSSSLDQLRAVLEVARSLASSFAVDDVLRTVVDAALRATGAERGFLLLFDERRELIVRTARTSMGGNLEPGELQMPRELIQKALENRRDLLSMSFDTSGAGDTAFAPAAEFRSVVCVPVLRMNIDSGANTTLATTAGSSAGVLYMDTRVATLNLAAGNRELLQTLAIEVSSVLENARLLEQEQGKQKIEEELAVARRIQQGLLPRVLPSDGWLRICGTSEACHEVGGDYFDAMRTASGEAWSIVVADVAGKGTSSALMASFLQGAFLGASAKPDMAGTLGRINEFLAEREEFGKYATVFYATIDAHGCMTYANAGHCAPLLVQATGTVEVLPSTSMPVGMMPGTAFATQQRNLAAGDFVVLYSDGVTEAQNSAGEFYGRARLRQAIGRVMAEAGAADCATLHDSIRRDLRQFTGSAPQGDDMTLVVLAYSSPEARADAPDALRG